MDKYNYYNEFDFDFNNTSLAINKGKRAYMEDAYSFFMYDGTIIMAVFDGHGGRPTAELLGKVMPDVYTAYKPDLKAMVDELARLTNNHYSGSTVSIAMVNSERTEATVAILGDSPVFIKHANGAIISSPEHNCRTNEQERKEAEARGAYCDGYYIYAKLSGGGLQMTRALGDCELSRILNREPEIYTVPIDKENVWILVCSDGLIDPGHTNPEAEKKIIDMMESGATAKELVDSIVADDNVTALVWRHKPLTTKNSDSPMLVQDTSITQS